MLNQKQLRIFLSDLSLFFREKFMDKNRFNVEKSRCFSYFKNGPKKC